MNWTKTAMVAACACALAAHGMPSQAELQQAQGVVTEVMRSDVAAFNAGKKKPAEVADAALRYAGEAQGEAARFLLIKGAFYYRMRAGDYDGAMDAIAQMRRDIADVPDKTIADILSGALRRVPRKHCGQLYDLLQRTQNRIRYTKEVEALAAKAKANPSDKAVRTALGEMRALLGDWGSALPELAAGEGPAAKAAALEQDAKTGEAADAWWALAGTDGSDRSLAYRAHAVRLYRAAVRDGSLAGLKKTLAEKRIAEAKADGLPDEPEEATSVSLPRHGAASEPRGSGAPAASPAPVASGERPKPLVFDLGGGVKMEMMGCPAGKFERHVAVLNRRQALEITRAFWIGKFPVTIEQWERLMPRNEPPQGVSRDAQYPKVPVMCGNQMPKASLSRQSAEDFMEKLTRRFKNQIPDGYTFRLPTMAEWAHAFMAMSRDPSDPYADGNRATDADWRASFVNRDDCLAYWQERGVDVKRFREGNWVPYVPVGQRRPNKWGICDMGGATIEPLLDSGLRQMSDNRAALFPNFLRRNADSAFADGIRDPLILETASQGGSTSRFALVSQGGEGDFRTRSKPYASVSMIPYGFIMPNPFYVLKLRLVVGPDLLKERGIAPPKPGR